jgi:hypothetical protein
MNLYYKILNYVTYPFNFLLKALFFKKFDGPLIMIIGNHASGGTLLYQIFVSLYKVNYLNNVSAKLFKNLFLSQILNILFSFIKKNFISNLKSTNGITKGVFEPNEFGWFWKKIFIRKKNIKSNDLKKYIDEINCLREIPFVFKYSVFDKIEKLSKNISLLNKTNKKLIIIRIKRNSHKIIKSILKRRLKLFNDINFEYGYFPKEIKIKDPYLKVKKQVHLIEKEIDAGLSKISKKNIIILDLDKLKKTPLKQLNKLDQFMQKHHLKKKINFDKLISKIKKN